MSKELSPLEALNEFRILVGDYEKKWDKKTYEHFMNNVNIIENALNDNHFYLYIIDKICKYLSIDVSSHRDLVETENEILNTLVENEKKLKALKIIKEKEVNISALLELDSLQQYNDYCDMVSGCKKLTQEEFDLLKEVLK